MDLCELPVNSFKASLTNSFSVYLMVVLSCFLSFLLLEACSWFFEIFVKEKKCNILRGLIGGESV